MWDRGQNTDSLYEAHSDPFFCERVLWKIRRTAGTYTLGQPTFIDPGECEVSCLIEARSHAGKSEVVRMRDVTPYASVRIMVKHVEDELIESSVTPLVDIR